jgi:hypothetical protein
MVEKRNPDYDCYIKIFGFVIPIRNYSKSKVSKTSKEDPR